MLFLALSEVSNPSAPPARPSHLPAGSVGRAPYPQLAKESPWTFPGFGVLTRKKQESSFVRIVIISHSKLQSFKVSGHHAQAVAKAAEAKRSAEVVPLPSFLVSFILELV